MDLVLYGNATRSDIDYIMDTADFTSFPSSLSSTGSSTRSDAQSAPPDFDQLFIKLCDEYARCVHETGRVLPPEWPMPDLVRAVIGDDKMDSPGFLANYYYDVMLHGQNAWLCDDLFHFLDLINYVF